MLPVSDLDGIIEHLKCLPPEIRVARNFQTLLVKPVVSNTSTSVQASELEPRKLTRLRVVLVF